MNQTMADDLLPHHKHVSWDQPDMSFRMYVGYPSLLFDVGVLAYHFKTPFHPKFYVNSTRREALRVHIIRGSLESEKYAYAAAAFGAIAHVPSTFYQIPIVLGIKAFLVPSLGMCRPDEHYKGILEVLDDREPSRNGYRARKKVVLEALITAAEIANTVEPLLVQDRKDRYSRIFSTVMTANARNTSPREKAHAAFRAIDVNRDNELSVAEFKDFLLACGMSPNGTEDRLLLDGLFRDRKVATADDFCARFNKNWIHSSSISVPRLPYTPRGEAQLVFNALDADGSGELDLSELETLLSSWSLPRSEAVVYLKVTTAAYLT
ncbi:hypothetical protein BGX29_005501 [Mortierella sp. GBA35]|nr:hypothetical protein BGX29_005501 [Mortierella sp. GBA35]